MYSLGRNSFRLGGEGNNQFVFLFLVKEPPSGPAACLLQKSRFVFVLYVRSKLDLGLNAPELAGLVEGHGVGAVEDVITGLKDKPGCEQTSSSLDLRVLVNLLVNSTVREVHHPTGGDRVET